MPGITVRVGSTAELRKLSRRLRTAGAGGLRRDLQVELGRTARPVLAATKAKVRGAEFTGSQGGTAYPDTSTGLRRRLAAATTVEPLRTGVRFEVHGEQVDPDHGAQLAKYTDTEMEPRWRHPVFKHAGRQKTKWTTQIGQPWFFVTIRAAETQFRGGVREAMAKTARKITG